MSQYSTIGRCHIDELPTASAINYRQVRICWDTATEDVLVICLKKSDDTYSWFEIGITEI